MRTFKVFSIVLLVAMLLGACSGGGAKTLKVAVLAPLSGPVPTFGVSTRDGALLAIKQWNANGGVLGMQVQAIVEDSQCTPDPAVNAANKVIDQDKYITSWAKFVPQLPSRSLKSPTPSMLYRFPAPPPTRV